MPPFLGLPLSMKHTQDNFNIQNVSKSGSEKGVFWKRGLFRKVHFLETLENLEILEILENPQTGKQRRIRPFREILENLEIFEIQERFLQ